MTDYGVARQNMVESQIRTSDVTHYGLLSIMGRLPRERFVPGNKRSLAYIDEDLEITRSGGEPRFLMEPRVFAKLVQAVDVRPGDLVLNVGCGSGYSTAVLAALAGAVVGLESDEDLAKAAQEALVDLDIDNAAIVTGPLAEGCAKQGPYDVILIDGGAERVPDALFEQLKPGGRLAAVVGPAEMGQATIFTRTENGTSGRVVFDAAVPALSAFAMEHGFTF